MALLCPPPTTTAATTVSTTTSRKRLFFKSAFELNKLSKSKARQERNLNKQPQLTAVYLLGHKRAGLEGLSDSQIGWYRNNNLHCQREVFFLLVTPLRWHSSERKRDTIATF